MTATVDPDDNRSSTVYNAIGKPEQTIDRLGNTTWTVYDARGNVIETRYPDNTLSRTVYDADGRAYVSQDRHVTGQPANGSRSIYDSVGRVIRSERLGNVVVTISDNQSVFGGADAVISSTSSVYDRAGRVILSTDAGGGTTRYEYDAAGRTAAVTDALGSRTTYAYDAAGRQTAVRDALGREVKYQYDALGRKIRTLFPDGTTAGVVYNTLGQKVEETDQAGLTTKFEYDAVGRLASVVKPEVTDPESGNLAAPRWSYTYDMYGRQVKITDPKGRETKFAYDELGRQRSRTLPLGQSESMQYNTLGQLSKQTDFKGQSVDFLYDSLGRPERRNYNPSTVGTPGETVQFVYDTLVRQDRVIDARGTTNYNYDLEGRLTQAQTPEGSLNYEYDAVTGRKTRTWTASSDQRYTYDELGRLKTVGVYKRGGVSLGSPEITTYSYTKVGSRESVALPNGVQTQYQYDNLNRLTSVAHYNATSELLGSYQYTLAPNGRRTAVAEQRRETDNTLSTTNIAFTYDKLNRLMSEAAVSTVSTRSYSSQYAYDLVGNRLSKVSAAETINYVYNANDQLENENSSVKGNVSYQYDANGCLTTKTGGQENCAYTYNLQGRMSGAVITRMESGQNVNISSTYAYAPSGIRTKAGTTVNGVVQNQVFLVDQMNHTGYAQVLEELNATGGDAVKSYTLGDDVLSQSVNGTVSHLIYDGHGSTRMLTAANGAITARYDYDAYGMMSGGNPGVTNPAATDFLYSGEQFDHAPCAEIGFCK